MNGTRGVHAVNKETLDVTFGAVSVNGVQGSGHASVTSSWKPRHLKISEMCGAGEMVQRIRCLLYRHEDLSSVPRSPVKSQCWAAEDSRIPRPPWLASLF